MTELSEIIRELSTRPGAGRVLATLVTVAGSSYRRPGARLLWLPEGRKIGSISGGCLEEDVLARAAAVARSGQAEVVTYDTTAENDLVWGVGLGCHGVVQVFIEPLPPGPPWLSTLARDQAENRPTTLAVVWGGVPPNAQGTRLAEASSAGAAENGVFLNRILPPTRLAVFGAGDDAQPLVALAHQLGWQVTVADPRPEFVTAERFPQAATLVCAPAQELVAQANPPPEALAVTMTHRYLHDVPILRALLPRPLAYVGLLGPRRRAERILAELTAEGLALTPAQRATLHAPVGLDLGAETPAEVALSMLAEMRAVLAQRDGRPLRDRAQPIHA